MKEQFWINSHKILRRIKRSWNWSRKNLSGPFTKWLWVWQTNGLLHVLFMEWRQLSVLKSSDKAWFYTFLEEVNHQTAQKLVVVPADIMGSFILEQSWGLINKSCSASPWIVTAGRGFVVKGSTFKIPLGSGCFTSILLLNICFLQWVLKALGFPV